MRAQESPRATTQVPFGPGPGTSEAVGVMLGGRGVTVGAVAVAPGVAVGGRGVTVALAFGVAVDGTRVGEMVDVAFVAVVAATVSVGAIVVDAALGSADAVAVGSGLAVPVGAGSGVSLATGGGCIGAGCNTTTVRMGWAGVDVAGLAAGDTRNLKGSLK